MRIVGIFAMTFAISVASCGETSESEGFSAYAISNTTLKGAFAISRPTAIDAERQAIAACEAAAGDGSPCRQVLWFTEDCGAIAVGVRLKADVADWAEASRNGDLLQIGNGVGKDAAQACGDAVRICQSAGGANCGAREFACMDSGAVGACPVGAAASDLAHAARGAPNYIGYAFSKEARSGAFAFSKRSIAEAQESAVEECKDAAGVACAPLGAFEADCAATATRRGKGVSVAPGLDAKSACNAAVEECGSDGAACNASTYACSFSEPGFCNEL